MKETDSGMMIMYRNNNCIYGSIAGTPILPIKNINVLISPEEDYEKVALVDFDIITLAQGTSICRYENPIPASSFYRITILDDSVSSKNIFERKPLIEYTGHHHIDGHHYLSFQVSPFYYNSSSKTLSLVTSAKIRINLKAKKVINKEFFCNRDTDCDIKKKVINSEDYDILYKSERSDLKSVSDTIDYMIVTSNNLRSSFLPLAEWKKQKGIRSIVLTVEEICSTYSGASIQEKIKSAINDYYYSHALKYVLLGGDDDIVPSLRCVIKYLGSNISYVDYTPTDLYYSCPTDLNWDANGNGIFGEVEDAIDLSPEIAVTRVPVATPSETNSFINKVISYEKSSDIANWTNNILMAGYRTITQSDGQIVCKAQLKSNMLYQSFIQPYWNGERFQFFKTGNDFNDGLPHPLTPNNLQERLSKGFSIVNILTHGSPLAWSLPNNSYNVNYANNLANSKYSIIITSACLTNAFDSVSICLSESFIRNANSGILAFLGCSRYGWSYSDDNLLGPSNECNGFFYRNLFTNKEKSFGDIAKKMKQDIIDENVMTYSNVYRWLQMGINPIGDPEMPIFTSLPQVFEPPVITKTNGQINVISNIDSCRLCVMSLENNGASYYKVVHNTNSIVFPVPAQGVSLCITKPGYVPYIVNIFNKRFIQDENLLGNNIYISDNLYVGTDVTCDRQQGPVTISSGYTRMKPDNGVTIKNGFTVNKGTELEIK